MSRIVVWLALAGVLWWWLRRPGVAAAAARPPAVPAPRPLLRCAHCGAHFPADEAVRDETEAYCGEAHRALAARSRAH
jgi:uncharacterized protein